MGRKLQVVNDTRPVPDRSDQLLALRVRLLDLVDIGVVIIDRRMQQPLEFSDVVLQDSPLVLVSLPVELRPLPFERLHSFFRQLFLGPT